MDKETAERLRQLNNEFYRTNWESFSSTRKAPWPGWKKALEMVQDSWEETPSELSVFDLACGNLRFEAFLLNSLPNTQFSFYAVDNCDALVPKGLSVEYQNIDVLELLLAPQDTPLVQALSLPACDVSVSFGFLHHVPLMQNRVQVLDALLHHTKPGGFVVVSLWQFMKHPSMAQKARAVHAKAMVELGLGQLEENDYLLGWNEKPGAYRYCHSFSEIEIDALLAAVRNAAELVARFHADGRSGDLNTYLVLKKR